MLALLAWRNIWRNHRRSLIILVSIMTGVSSMIFTEGLSRGFLRQVFENQLGSHIAHIQIHTRGFRDNPTAQGFMRDTLRVPAAVRQYAGVRAFSMRAIAFGLVSSASGSSGVSLVGVRPGEEARVTTIARSVVEGRYLSGASHEIVISRKVAETLDLRIGDRVVAMASAVDGKVGSEMFRVVGVYRSASSAFDRMYVYIPIQDLQEMVRVGDAIAEVAIVLDDASTVLAVRDSLRRQLDESYEVLAYQDIVPLMVSQLRMAENSMLIFYGIIGLAMVFGIINTMLMSVFERIHEFGVLKAVGMKNGTLFTMIVLEALALGLLGTGGGALAGSAVTLLLARTGINFAAFSEGLASWGSSAIIYPVLEFGGVVSGMAVILLVCVAAAVYPAYRAIRLEPVNAIRYV